MKDPDEKIDNLYAEGWTQGKIDHMIDLFEKLSYDEIDVLLNTFGIRFLDDVNTIEKQMIVWTIADDKTYEEMLTEVEKINIENLKKFEFINPNYLHPV